MIYLLASYLLAVYANGLIYLVLLSGIFLWPTLRSQLKKFGKKAIAILGIWFIDLLPIIYSLIVYNKVNKLTTWLGYDLSSKAHQSIVILILKQLYKSVSSLLIYNFNLTKTLNIGHQAIVAYALGVFILLAIIYMLTHLSNFFYRFILATIVLNILLDSISPNHYVSLIYLFIICSSIGLAYLIRQYKIIFPINKLAYNYLNLVIYLIYGLIILINIQNYFVVSPRKNNSSTYLNSVNVYTNN